MFPDPSDLTPAQHAASVLVIYALIISVPGLLVLTAWSMYDSFREYRRRTAEQHADYLARRAAAEAAAEREGHELDQRLRRLFRLSNVPEQP
jgi:hypothetical protein